MYSPLQNIAVWFAAWLHGQISADECIDALDELGGRTYLIGTDPDEPAAQLELLKLVRRLGEAHLASTDPVVRLVLSGPGEAIGLRAGSESYRAAQAAGHGALVFPGESTFSHHVLVPVHWRDGVMGFQHFEEHEAAPAPAYLSPGEADLLLADATRAAADFISSSSVRQADLHNPRLTVGTLSDFYDTPGLPFCTPPRAAKLFARADRVAAIIETVGTHVGGASFDPHVLPLMRHVRLARMSGVAYAAAELARLNDGPSSTY
ncbi:hypothetical protein [Corynebacterium sp. H130]|uniref:hypothetical protein n=1 Tax=Corynebacterium sp. H130 TaxID=3133444 RepID=UPI0030B2B054